MNFSFAFLAFLRSSLGFNYAVRTPQGVETNNSDRTNLVANPSDDEPAPDPVTPDPVDPEPEPDPEPVDPAPVAHEESTSLRSNYSRNPENPSDAGNEAPVAVSDTASGTESQKLVVDVLANDTDADDKASDLSLDSVKITNVTGNPGNNWGKVWVNSQDRLVFDPQDDFDGLRAGEKATVTVDYIMSDDDGATSTSTATITVNGQDEAAATDAKAPDAPDQSGDNGDSNGADKDTSVVAQDSVEVMAGRVTTLLPEGDDITDVRIVSGVDHGNITVNPDNSLALVMTLSDFTGAQSFSYEATHKDGSVTLHEVELNVVPGMQDAGWGTSEAHYMLETDEDDRVVVEHGDVHTKVYISGSTNALSLEDIAALEGLDVSKITGKWLAENSTYGQSEDMALDAEAGMKLWGRVTDAGSDTSNWLLFERGYEYHDLGRILDRNTEGESELNPLYMGAYGDGDQPVITSKVPPVAGVHRKPCRTGSPLHGRGRGSQRRELDLRQRDDHGQRHDTARLLGRDAPQHGFL